MASSNVFALPFRKMHTAQQVAGGTKLINNKKIITCCLITWHSKNCDYFMKRYSGTERIGELE